MVRLVERDGALEQLHGWLRESRDSRGRIVWVSGEAGAGKTVLIRRFVTDIDTDVLVLEGDCDPLSTPRPLGPLVDIAPRLDPTFARMLRDEPDRDAIFSGFLKLLANADRPRVIVFEDVHWADQATLDLLQYLGRRIGETNTLLLATYRDDEVGIDHPLTRVLGHLATEPDVRRLDVPVLSMDAVTELAADSTMDPEELYQRTGGNPFFLSEVLAVQDAVVPRTVRDAVYARAARLTPAGRRCLEAASVIGARVEPWLLAELEPDALDGVDDCIRVGILVPSGTMIAFRHDLVREAVLESLAPQRRMAHHRKILSVLRNTPTVADADGMARLAHHAEEANDAAAVLAFAPSAARRAARLKAHREAAAQFRRALRFAPRDDRVLRAELLEAQAYESYLTSDTEDAMTARKEALALRRELGDTLAEGSNLRWISRLSWFLGRRDLAQRAATQAIEILERHPGTSELGWAYSNQSQLSMLAYEEEDAIRWGELALDLGTRLGDVELRAHALNNLGTVRYADGSQEGRELLESALRLALEHDLEEHVARAYTNLAANAVRNRNLEQATAYLEDGIRYCTDHDLDAWNLYMLGWRTLRDMYAGCWDEATATAHRMLKRRDLPPVSKIQPLVALAHIRARRGDDEVRPLLDEAQSLAEAANELQRLAPVAVAYAEYEWLTGLPRGAVDLLSHVYELSLPGENPWVSGELAMWMRKLGQAVLIPAWMAAPFALEARGRWREAADAWRKLGCPYDAARALLGSDQEADLHDAFKAADELGATAAKDLVQRRLRDLGLRGPPTGPRPSTLRNPAQLTKRQLQVLQLMAEGLTNTEIAGRLYRSTKTIDHHVSAILMKLEAQNRTEAVRIAADMGLLTAPARSGDA